MPEAILCREGGDRLVHEFGMKPAEALSLIRMVQEAAREWRARQ
jgi:hypothetical protein